MSDENIKNNDQLNLDDLDEVAGGYLYQRDNKYEVIDERGEVVASFSFRSHDEISRMNASRLASDAARARGLSGYSLSYGELRRLRGQ